MAAVGLARQHISEGPRKASASEDRALVVLLRVCFGGDIRPFYGHRVRIAYQEEPNKGHDTAL